MNTKAEGIVLRATDYGESNKIITLFTREYGKVGLMARGAKKPRSKLSASSQILTHGVYIYSIGKGLGTLHQGEVENPFRYLKADIYKMAYAAYIVDFIDKMPAADTLSPPLFQLVLTLLNEMNNGLEPQVLMFIFEVKMLAVLGIEPVMSGCIHCGRTDGPFKFSVSGGGLLCFRCTPEDPHAVPVSETFIKLFKLFRQINVARLGKINLKPETLDEFKRILTMYYDANSGMRLKTKRFIEQIEAADAF